MFFTERKCFRKVKTSLGGAVLLLLVFQMPMPLAAETVEEGARREGKVLFYSSVPAPVTQALMNAFQKKYPYIKAESYRAATGELLNKIIAEKQMGQTFSDVVSASGTWITLLKKSGLLARYVAPEAKILPPGFKDPEGFWTANYTAFYTFTYNTRMVAKKDLPKTYEDLLNPQWKGKIGINLAELDWYIGMMDYLGEAKARPFMKRLAEQEPILRNGRSVTAMLMLAGEFPLALGVVQTTRQRQVAGAPIDMIPLPGPYLAALRTIGVHANAPHPNAAKLMLNFLISQEGQTIYQQHSYDPVRSDVSVDPVVKKIMQNMFPIKPRDPEVVESYKKEMAQIFQARRVAR